MNLGVVDFSAEGIIDGISVRRKGIGCKLKLSDNTASKV